MPNIYRKHADGVAAVQRYCTDGPMFVWAGDPLPDTVNTPETFTLPCSASVERREQRLDPVGGFSDVITRSVTVLASWWNGKRRPVARDIVGIIPQPDQDAISYRVEMVEELPGGTLLRFRLIATRCT